MEFSELESFAFKAAVVWAAGALGLTCVALLIGKRQVGRAVHVVRGSRKGRLVVWLGCLSAVVWAVSSGAAAAPLALTALGIGLVVSFMAPSVEDMVLGEHGVRHGWQARSWKQLEGWRLVGSHLRFLVHGELVAVEVPLERMDEVRAKLALHCPSTENPLGSTGDGNAPVGDR